MIKLILVTYYFTDPWPVYTVCTTVATVATVAINMQDPYGVGAHTHHTAGLNTEKTSKFFVLAFDYRTCWHPWQAGLAPSSLSLSLSLFMRLSTLCLIFAALFAFAAASASYIHFHALFSSCF
jgi:hypothetical protein